MAEDHTIIAVVGILGIVALAGLILFAMMRTGGAGGSVAVLDSDGKLLYNVTDTPIRRVVGNVNFVPESL